MKRYGISDICDDCHAETMRERKHGEYVLYDDIKHLLNSNKQEILIDELALNMIDSIIRVIDDLSFYIAERPDDASLSMHQKRRVMIRNIINQYLLQKK